MKTFIKIISVTIILMLLCLTLTGCEPSWTRLYGATQSCYAVPGGFCENYHIVRGNFISEDNYGRVLYSQSTGFVDALLICQKYDDEYVYYYDNVCYIQLEDYMSYTDAQIEKLKEVNDWNKPSYNEEVMVKKVLHSGKGFSPQIYQYQTLAIYCESLFVDTVFDKEGANNSYFVSFCDRDKNGKEIFYIVTYNFNGGRDDYPNYGRNPNMDYSNSEYYLMLVGPGVTYNPDTYIVKLENKLESNEPLARLKEMNGWVA